MRALSLWQPHATLMALVRPEPNPRRLAEKVFETRPQWARRVPLGPLVIHAAKSTEDLALLDFDGRGNIAEAFRLHGVTGETVPLGAAVAVVDVVAKWETARPRWRMLDATPGTLGPSLLAGLHQSAFAFGDFSPGRILLQCENVRPLSEPLPMRGYQQIWKLTPEQVAQVNAQTAPLAEVGP